MNIFSQEMFVEKNKQRTTVIGGEKEEKIIAFLNIIPDYVKTKAHTICLRKTADAPNGINGLYSY